MLTETINMASVASNLMLKTYLSQVWEIVILFKDGHAQQLRPETIVVLRQIRNDFGWWWQMVSGDKCGLNFLSKNPGKNFKQETDPTEIWTRATGWEVTAFPLDHNGDSREIVWNTYNCMKSEVERHNEIAMPEYRIQF